MAIVLSKPIVRINLNGILPSDSSLLKISTYVSLAKTGTNGFMPSLSC